jgi:hypothetical protein
MATDYPGDIDSFAVKTDNVTDVMAADVNDLQDAVEAIETELGSDPAGTAADVKTRLAQSLDGLGNLDFKAIGALTISGGSVTPIQNWHVVDTEGSAASDDLDTIAVTNVTDGFVLFLRQANDARDVTLKHGTGNISCPGGVDIALADTTQVVMLIYDGTLTKWLASICPSNVALTNKSNTWAAEQILTKSERHAYTSISTNTTLDATQNVVDVDVTSASVAITLPTAVGINGREYVIRKLDSSANTVTITPNGSETVNGSSDIVLDEQYESTIIYSDGANWIQLATGGGGGASSDLIEHTHTGSTDGGLLRIDTIAAPTDTTANDVSLSAHGLFPKLPGTSDTYWNGKGEWATISGGSASSDLIEHGHTGAADGGLLRLDTISAPTDSTSLNASTDAHGLLPKLSGLTNVYLRGDGVFSGLVVATSSQVGGGFAITTSNFIAGTTDSESYYRFVSQDNFNALMRSGTTDFDASTDTHGFLPKLSGSSDEYMNGIGEWGTPASGVREMLTADRTYYVRTDGNDSNTGLVNSAGGAFLTIQKAVDVSAALDCSIYNITIQVADGTYVANTVTCKNILGAGTVTIQGNSSTPSNVIIDGGFSKTTPGTTYTVKDLLLEKATGSATDGIKATSKADITIGNLIFHTGFTRQIYVDTGGNVFISSAYNITGGATNHIVVSQGSSLTSYASVTVASGLAFTIFIAVSMASSVIYTGTITKTGTESTGKKYSVSLNGVLNTIGESVDYFPGDAAGTTSTGGLYA